MAAWGALLAIILLGVPHGALDGEIARPYLRTRYGRLWFVVFAVPYLGLAAMVLLAWHIAPGLTLASFLAGSVWHFGSDRPGQANPLGVVITGGLPIALPSLFHPVATAKVFATVAQVAMPELPQLLFGCSLAWLGAALLWRVRLGPSGRLGDLRVPAIMAAAFFLLTPLVAFALYFVCIHAPEHVRQISHDPARAPRVTPRNVVLRSLPVTGLTVLIGAMLLPFYGGSGFDRLLALTIQGLAALTLPHMLLERVSHGRPQAAGTPVLYRRACDAIGASRLADAADANLGRRRA
nr:Brp/Blh family beta-carotene 15,15'-dioxygenase [uncultured Lichenicoccus sp.]